MHGLYAKLTGGGAFDLTLTDIPFGGVNRESNGLIVLDKGAADIETFNIHDFLNYVYEVTKSTIIIFCAKEQLSEIFLFFLEKQKMHEGTVRHLIWEKTNPSPMNGQYVYLSGIENAIWFKKRGGTFNARCKNPIFKYPCGRSKLHPTEKHHGLLEELILDNSNPGDILFDPCAGSGSHCLVAKQLDRKYVGVELNKDFYNTAVKRLSQMQG